MGLLVLGLAAALSAPVWEGWGEWAMPVWMGCAAGVGEKVPGLGWGTMDHQGAEGTGRATLLSRVGQRQTLAISLSLVLSLSLSGPSLGRYFFEEAGGWRGARAVVCTRRCWRGGEVGGCWAARDGVEGQSLRGRLRVAAVGAGGLQVWDGLAELAGGARVAWRLGKVAGLDGIGGWQTDAGGEGLERVGSAFFDRLRFPERNGSPCWSFQAGLAEWLAVLGSVLLGRQVVLEGRAGAPEAWLLLCGSMAFSGPRPREPLHLQPGVRATEGPGCCLGHRASIGFEHRLGKPCFHCAPLSAVWAV